MKTLLISIITGFLLSNSLSAKKYPGYIIDKEGNKKEVVFKCRYVLMAGSPDYADVQKSIKYVEGKQTKTLFPSQCTKIGLTTPYETIEFVSKPNKFLKWHGIIDSHIFLRIKSQGPITVYYYYYWQSLYDGRNSSSFLEQGWILDNENGKYAIRGQGGKKKDFNSLFSDYPDLVRRMENKETKKWDVHRYVEEYNNWIIENKIQQGKELEVLQEIYLTGIDTLIHTKQPEQVTDTIIHDTIKP